MDEPINAMQAEPLLAELAAAAQQVESLPPVDHDALTKQYLDTFWRNARRSYFERVCPPEYQVIDWARVEANERMQPNIERMRKVMAWDSSSKKGLILSGPTGRGKTLSCYGLARRILIDDNKDIICITANEFFERLQQEVHYGRDDAGKFIRDIAAKPVVMIDDYGQECLIKSKEDWSRSHFFQFLDIRVGRGLPIILSTNLSADEMAGTKDKHAIKGDPIVRRILDLADPVRFV